MQGEENIRMNAATPPINEQLVRLVKFNALEILGGERTPARALELARQAHSWAEHLIERFESANPLPHPIACQPGCDYCCYNQIEVTPLEALAIWGFIRNFPSENKARIQEKIQKSVQQRAGKIKEEIAGSRGAFPCPFLENGLCAIYPVRPLLCRAMHSLDAGHCQQSLQAENLIPDQYYLHRDEIVHSLIMGITEGCRELGCEAKAVDLARAVLTFFEKGDNLTERWTQGESVFA